MNEYGIEILSSAVLHKMWWANPENKKMMSEIRLCLWRDNEYYTKTSAHLFDENTIKDRAKKHSAALQGLSTDQWAGFITPERIRARQTVKYDEWRTAVFERDDYRCQCCGARSKKGQHVVLNAHHLDSFASNIELRYDVDNGVTLCYDCHDIRAKGSFHNIYGVKNNTRTQFEEYLRMTMSKGMKGMSL